MAIKYKRRALYKNFHGNHNWIYIAINLQQVNYRNEKIGKSTLPFDNPNNAWNKKNYNNESYYIKKEENPEHENKKLISNRQT